MPAAHSLRAAASGVRTIEGAFGAEGSVPRPAGEAPPAPGSWAGARRGIGAAATVAATPGVAKTPPENECRFNKTKVKTLTQFIRFAFTIALNYQLR